eukprot:g9549.t2
MDSILPTSQMRSASLRLAMPRASAIFVPASAQASGHSSAPLASRGPWAATAGVAGALGVAGVAGRSTSSKAEVAGHVSSGAGELAGLPFLYGTAWKEGQTAELVVKAVRAGFRGIDTACQPKHYQEDLVGEALARLASEDHLPREQLWLQTKFTPIRGQDPRRVPYDTQAPLKKQVEQSIQKSLENLRTSYIDSLMMHSPMPTLEENLEVWGVFEQAVEAGHVRQLGISNCYDPRVFQMIYDAVRIKPKVLQNRFYADSGYDRELRAFCLENGVKYQTFWTLTANPHLLDAWRGAAGGPGIGGAWDPHQEVKALHVQGFQNFLVFSGSNLIFCIFAVTLASARFAFLGRSRSPYDEVLGEAP